MFTAGEELRQVEWIKAGLEVGRVINAERKDFELEEAATGAVSFWKGGTEALCQGGVGPDLKVALEN